MKSPAIMYAYAAFLVICGLIAYFMAPADARATTALLIPVIAAGLMVVFGSMAHTLHRNRTTGMIGIHIGLALPVLFTAAFGYQAYSVFTTGGEEKQYLAVILSIMTVGSIIAFLAILVTRPKPEART